MKLKVEGHCLPSRSDGVVAIKIEEDTDEMIAPRNESVGKSQVGSEINKVFDNYCGKSVTIKEEPASICLLAPAPLDHNFLVKLEAKNTADFSDIFDSVPESEVSPITTAAHFSYLSSELILELKDPEIVSSENPYPGENIGKLEPSWVDLVASIKVETEGDVENTGIDDVVNRATQDHFRIEAPALRPKPCFVVLKRIDELSRKNVEAEIEFTCDHCKTGFYCKKALTRHITRNCQGLKGGSRAVEEPGPRSSFICNHCKNIFRRKEFLLKHIRYHCVVRRLKPHNIIGPCYYSQILPHLDDVEVKRPQCSDCGKYFSRPDTLKKHVQVVHGRTNAFKPSAKTKRAKESKSFFCNRCNKSIPKKSAFARHLYHHKYYKTMRFRKEQRGVCKVCDKSFDDSYDFHRHMRWAHVEQSRTFRCEHCDKTFPRSYELTRHMQRAQRIGSTLHSE